MEDDRLIKITPDKERAKSIMDMVELRQKRVDASKDDAFSTLLLEDYYEIIKELATAVLNLNGYKTLSHKTLFDYLKNNFRIFSSAETEPMHELRKTRNKVVYEGFFIKPSYLRRNKPVVKSIILKLRKLAGERCLK